MGPKIRVYVRCSEWTESQELFIFEDVDGKTFNWTLGPSGVIKSTRKELDPAAPFLTVPGPVARVLFPALVESLSQSGFERPSESTLRGKCEAQSAHLEDLRKLLKLSK